MGKELPPIRQREEVGKLSEKRGKKEGKEEGKRNKREGKRGGERKTYRGKEKIREMFNKLHTYICTCYMKYLAIHYKKKYPTYSNSLI